MLLSSLPWKLAALVVLASTAIAWQWPTARHHRPRNIARAPSATAPTATQPTPPKLGVLLLNLGGPEKQESVEGFLYNLFAVRIQMSG